MASLKEVSVEIKGCPYTFFRRVEKSDTPWWHKDYIPFVVVSDSDPEQQEILFNQNDEMIQRLKNEYGQNVLATGEIFMNWSTKTMDQLRVSSRMNSTKLERKQWIETILSRINPAILNDRVWIEDHNQEVECYVYHPVRDFNPSKPEVFPVFPRI